jgi:SPP1 family predicted phage head-tail adaptor
MDSSKYDRRITLQRLTLAAIDANGSSAQSYTDYATVSAKKIDAGGREYFAAQQVQAELATRFEIRYRTDVLPTDRISFAGKSFNISHMAEIGRKEALTIFATAVVNG